MNKEELFQEILKKQTYLCVGLDTDIKKIPKHLLKCPDPVFEFNKQIIDATIDHCVAYKPNIAFYEANGAKGWESLARTMEYIPENLFTIADAKRGDIGNTSSLYARAFFKNMKFHAITVAPYMGHDSVLPFLDFKGKWVILLALTSNPGSGDFQQLEVGKMKLYEKIIKSSLNWGSEDQLMYVVGATKATFLQNIRSIIPRHFLLVPGVGAQGGNLEEVSKFGLNDQGGLLVNASRSIIYASDNNDFAKQAGESAKKIQLEMETYLNKYG